MPYFFCTLVPPPSGRLPPLQIACPPMCGSASSRITSTPASRATIAAGKPVAPAPITTTSVARSQRRGGRVGCAAALSEPRTEASPAAPAPLTSSRREIFRRVIPCYNATSGIALRVCAPGAQRREHALLAERRAAQPHARRVVDRIRDGRDHRLVARLAGAVVRQVRAIRVRI